MNLRKQACLLMLLSASVSADASSSDDWEAFSDVGAYGMVGAALALPAYKGDWEGLKQACFSVAAASGAGMLGKSLIDAERPDKSGNDSFPSNHTANAFAAATTLNLRYGWEAGLPAYGIAALVGIGRVEADRHYWKDVLAGAVIGSLAGWVFTDSFDDDVQIAPWSGRNEAGLTLSMSW